MPVLAIIGFSVMGISAVVMFIFAYITDFPVVFYLACALTILGGATGFYSALFMQPLDKQYEQKVNAITEAEKELQKFLIDHPEFKENNNEQSRT